MATKENPITVVVRMLTVEVSLKIMMANQRKELVAKKIKIKVVVIRKLKITLPKVTEVALRLRTVTSQRNRRKGSSCGRPAGQNSSQESTEMGA